MLWAWLVVRTHEIQPLSISKPIAMGNHLLCSFPCVLVCFLPFSKTIAHSPPQWPWSVSLPNHIFILPNFFNMASSLLLLWSSFCQSSSSSRTSRCWRAQNSVTFYLFNKNKTKQNLPSTPVETKIQSNIHSMKQTQKEKIHRFSLVQAPVVPGSTEGA